MIPKFAPAEDCNKTRQECEAIVQAFEREVELKDLMIQKQDETIRLIERQRDDAYKLAEHNPSLYNKVMLGITGVGLGCAAMAEKAEIRLICLAAGAVTCALGGC